MYGGNTNLDMHCMRLVLRRLVYFHTVVPKVLYLPVPGNYVSEFPKIEGRPCLLRYSRIRALLD